MPARSAKTAQNDPVLTHAPLNGDAAFLTNGFWEGNPARTINDNGSKGFSVRNQPDVL